MTFAHSLAKWATSACICAWAMAAQAAEVVNLKAIATTRNDAVFDLYEWMAAEVEKRTSGQVKVSVVSLPEVGLSGFEAIRVLRSGSIDMMDVISFYVTGDLPVIEAAVLPGIYRDDATALQAHTDFLPAYQSMEEKMGAKILGVAFYANQILYSKRPVRELSDFRGLKVRVAGTAQAELIKALGAEPVSVPYAEVYTALERGTVDGAITGFGSGKTLKLTEVTRYMVDIHHGPVLALLAISNKSWEKLPPSTRSVLEEVGKEFTRKAQPTVQKASEDGMAWNKERGMEWIPASEPVSQAIHQAAEKVIVPSWVKRAGDQGKNLFNQHLSKHTGISIP